MHKISVVIITYNESRNLSKCIESTNKIADEVIVLDSFSDDDTVQIAESHGAIVYQSEFKSFVDQKNKAFKFANYDIILSIDADEWLSEELSNSILHLKSQNEINTFYKIKRKNFFLGKWVRGGVWRREKKVKLFKSFKAKLVGYDVHETIDTTGVNRIDLIEGHLYHDPYKSISEFVQQMNKFSDIASKAYKREGITSSYWKIFLKPIWRFFTSYFINFGFIDGIRGLILSASFSYYTFLKYTKLWNLQNKEQGKIKH